MKEKLLVAGSSNFLGPHLVKKAVVAKETQTRINDVVFICNLAENKIPRTLTWCRKSELPAGKYLSEIKNLPLTGLWLAVKMTNRHIKTYAGNNQQKQIFRYVKDLAVLATGCL